MQRRRKLLGTVLALACALRAAPYAVATGVPIGGFLPQVGIALTNEFNDDLDTNAAYSDSPGGTKLGQGGTAHYDVALMDTGAALSLLTAQSYSAFNMDGAYPSAPNGFGGTEPITVGGANGSFEATIDDPVGLYAGGLQGVTSTSPLTISSSVLKGQTNTSLASMPAEADLPNVLGLTFVSQYATYIRNDQPQIQQINGRTVRSPAIEFNPIGGSSQGIARRAFVTLNPGASFAQPPFWFYNIANFDIDKPQNNPSIPTVIQGGMFLTTNVTQGTTHVDNNQLLFDTGADVTVLSEQIAYSQLGLDPDHPDFTVAVTGAGGTAEGIPGYFLDSFTIQATGGGGNLTLTNVPIVVLDVLSPVDGTNVLPGIVGMNAMAGRNVVINPKAGTVAAGIYISDPVTTSKNWTAATTSGIWSTGGNWNASTTPNNLGIANVRHVSGGNQVAELTASTTVWEVNVSGAAANQTMTLNVQNGVRLTTFSGINVESNGILQLSGGTLDAQFVEILGGTLRGDGFITTGSGSIPGQVESRGGTVSPGNGIGSLTIVGRFASGPQATLAIEIGGSAAGQYDHIDVTGEATADGTLAISLVNSFTPSIGAIFTLISATGNVGGTFNHLTAPDGYNWQVNYLANSVQLLVGNPGDFNNDGVVDARDYVVWRDTAGGPLNYSAWRSHFGVTYASGSSLGGNGVPEPASISLLLVAGGFALRRGSCRRSFCLWF